MGYDEALVERFFAKVAYGPGDACHVWTASKNPWGYGYFKTHGVNTYAHRFAWQLENGPIPDGKKLLHKCDNPNCVRVEHLFLGTNAENSADMVKKGRQAKGDTHGNAKFSEEVVRQIRADYKAKVGGIRKLAKKYGTYYTNIYKIIAGKTWSHVA